MGLYLDHINRTLSKLREPVITALSTNQDTEAYKAQVAVQRAVNRIFNHKTWKFRQRRETFATVASTALYELPKTVGEPYIVQSSGQIKTLQFVSEDDFDFFVPDPQETGDPRLLTIFDTVGVSSILLNEHIHAAKYI